MEEYQWNGNFENFELFPQHIYNDFGLIYHGTSVIYTEDIENNGFKINHLPFPNAGLREIINLLGDLGEPSNFNPSGSLFNFNFAGAIDHYLTYPHPISFTLAGYPALKFASGHSKGGQIVGKVKQSLNRIIALISQLPDTDANRIKLIRRFDEIQYIDNNCNAITIGQGVIYVIRPSSDIIQNLYVDHKVVFSKETIPLERILAKITVDANYEITENFQIQSENIINKHFSKPGTIGFNIFKSQLYNDDNLEN